MMLIWKLGIFLRKKNSSLDKDLEIFVKLINCIKGRERESSTKEWLHGQEKMETKK